MVVVEHPPLAGIAARADGRETRSELGPVAACADLFHDLRREQALAIDLALVQHQLSQPPKVTQTRGDAAACKGHALSIDRLIGILFDPHAPPQPVRGQFRHRLARDPADDPAQHVRVDGLVVEFVAVISLGLDLLQVFPIAVRPIVSLGFGQGACRCGVKPDIGVRIGIILGIFHARGHIHDLTDSRRGKGAVADFWNDVADKGRVVQCPFDHHDFGQKAGEGLGHRHDGMLAIFLQAAEVPLVDNLSLVQDQHPVGVIGIKRLFPGHRLVAVLRREGDGIDLRPQIRECGGRRIIQWHRRAYAAADLLGGQKLAQVAHGPAQPGKTEIDAVGLGDHLVFRRGKPLHPAQHVRIGILRGQRRGLRHHAL